MQGGKMQKDTGADRGGIGKASWAGTQTQLTRVL